MEKIINQGGAHSEASLDSARKRLAEIYFITSRCDQVRLLYSKSPQAQKDASSIFCACGGDCVPGSELGKLEAFRRALKASSDWYEPKMQAAWKQVALMPEARYWAIKALRRRQDRKSAALREELEKSLESISSR